VRRWIKVAILLPVFHSRRACANPNQIVNEFVEELNVLICSLKGVRYRASSSSSHHLQNHQRRLIENEPGRFSDELIS
jgi:hypothetical protein